MQRNNTSNSSPDHAKSQTIQIAVEQLRPLLEQGDYAEKEYLAICTSATCAWSTRWSKHEVILKMRLLDYTGKSYAGDLCKFLYVGRNPAGPRIGPRSQFYRLLVAINGAHPANANVDLALFVGQHFRITVRTVTHKSDKNQTPIPPELWYSVVDQIQFHNPLNPCNTRNTSNPRNPSNPNNPRNPENPRNPSNLSTYKQTSEPIQPSNTYNPLNPLEHQGSQREEEPFGGDFDFGEQHPIHSAHQGPEPRRVVKHAAVPRSQVPNSKTKKEKKK
jgi:hypothetical protein